MPATGFERTASREVTNTQVRRKYYITAESEEDVVVYVQSVKTEFPTIAGFPFADFQAQEVEEVDHNYELTVTWGQQSITSTPAPGTGSYRFNFQAPSAHIYQSLSTISRTEDPALLPFGPPSFGGAINVVWDAGKQRVEGFNLQPPGEVFSARYANVPDIITPTYIATVESLCGKVNNAAFLGHNAGEVMLVRASGELQGGVWNLEFGFAYIANATNIPVGDVIEVLEKDGLDLLWVYYLPTKDDTAKELVKQPACAFVERVFERADLNALNLPFLFS